MYIITTYKKQYMVIKRYFEDNNIKYNEISEEYEKGISK